MTRALTTIAAIGMLATACAPAAAPPRPPATTSAPAPAPTPAAPGPFTDRELADALVQQGVGVAKDGATAAPQPGDELPTEIRQTPRGVVVTFREVLFAFDSAELTPKARREIERMAFVLNHPQAATRHVALEGHADAIGTDAYNLDLSRRRADAVAQELVARGVHRDRLSVEGFGKRKPVAPNTFPDGRDNPAGRALNRRVEAVVQTSAEAPR
jgi:outer membrane protein OmpA-like peptidoglycan-associated protein